MWTSIGSSRERSRGWHRCRRRGCCIGGMDSLTTSVPIVDLLAHLLWQIQVHILTFGVCLGCEALFEGLGDWVDLGDGDALLLGQVLAGDPGQVDGLVHTGLDGLGVDDIHGGLNHGNNRHIVAGLLTNLFAVVVSVAVAIAVALRSRLAYSHHLGLTHLLKGDLNGLGCGSLSLGLVGVGADLVVDHLGALGTDGAGDGVALLNILDALASQLDRCAHCLKGRGAHLGSLHNIQDGAVVFWVLVAVVDNGVVGHGLVVLRSRGVSSVGRSWCVPSVGRGRGIAPIGGGMVLAHSQGHQGEEEQLGRLQVVTGSQQSLNAQY